MKNNWKIPDDAKRFFTKEAEKEAKEKYGVWYRIHTIVSFVIIFVHAFAVLFLLTTNSPDTTTKFGNLLGGLGGIIGLVGGFAIGVGLVNVFMALIKQYLGHLITLIGLVGGILLEAVSLLLFSLAH